MTLQTSPTAAFVAIKLSEVVKTAALLAETLPLAFADDAVHLEVKLADLVPLVVFFQWGEVSLAGSYLQCSVVNRPLARQQQSVADRQTFKKVKSKVDPDLLLSISCGQGDSR